MTRDKNSNRLVTWKVRRVFDSIMGLKEGKWFVSPTQHNVPLELRQMLESINRSEKRQCDNRFLGPLKLLSLLQQSRGKHACSDGVCQTPRGLGICYSKTIQREDREYTVLGSNSRV